MKTDELETQANLIIQNAINVWRPVAIISLYSGGYDSLVMTHLIHKLRPEKIQVWSIDTQMAADGWREYVTGVAAAQGWDFNIYDNRKGFEEWLGWVETNGAPYTKKTHHHTYNRLKGRGIAALLKSNKTGWHSKVLFLSGIRQAESRERQNLTNPIQRAGESNAIFANPLFYWSDEDVTNYRILHGLPRNPFYETVGGSGDCQCNWGNFITRAKLRQHAPELEAGNVAIVDKISRDCHGHGWDETPGARLFDTSDIDDGVFTMPFLCSSCSRAKSAKPGNNAAAEQAYMDRMFEL